jgi:hypothetical protein
MIGLLMALALAAPATASETLMRGGSVRPPPPISEEVKPYSACLIRQFEADPELWSPQPGTMQAVNARARAACAEDRRSAAARADATLKNKKSYRNPAKRQAGIEKVLSDTDRSLIMLYLTMTPPPQRAPQGTTALDDRQAAIVYDQCLARAASSASKTDAVDTAIFGIAAAACADLRGQLLAGAGAGSERRRIFDAIDADKQAGFPAATRKVREQRRAYGAELGTPK